MPSPSADRRIPTCMTCRTASSPHMATITAGPSGSYRSSAVKWPPSSRQASWATASKTLGCDAPRGDELRHPPQARPAHRRGPGGRSGTRRPASPGTPVTIPARSRALPTAGRVRSSAGPRFPAGSAGRRAPAGAPCRRARCRACGRCPVLCFSTVASLTESACAMPTFDFPSAIAASTARSRGVSSRSGSSAWRRPSIRPTTSASSALPPAATRAMASRNVADVADALLEQVADALGAVADELEREGGLAELREDEHAGRRAAGVAARSAPPGRRPRAGAASGRRRSPRRGDARAPAAGGRRRHRTARRRPARRR